MAAQSSGQAAVECLSGSVVLFLKPHPGDDVSKKGSVPFQLSRDLPGTCLSILEPLINGKDMWELQPDLEAQVQRGK